MKVCNLPGCNRKARYFMGRDNEDGKHFSLVCATHDRELGRTNLMRYMTLPEAIAFERYLAETADLLEYPDFPEWLETLKGISGCLPPQVSFDETELRELNLPPRAFNTLYRNQITIDELLDMPVDELMKIRKLGKSSVTAIQEALKRYESD